MLYKSIDLLSQQTFDPDLGIDSYYGERIPGDGFYGKSDGLHTVQHSVNNFIGKFIVQGTLVFNPTESDWFNVICKKYNISGESESSVDNFVGNYIWIRAIITDWEQGSILVARMNH